MGMLDILTREQERKVREAYLYEEEGGRWYAYERSAELLNDSFKGIVTIKQFIHDTFLVINRVELDLGLLENISIVSCSDTQITVTCPQRNN